MNWIIGGAIVYALYKALPFENGSIGLKSGSSSEKISPNFRFSEFETTSTGLNNSIPEDKKAWIVALVQEILQPLRDEIGPIVITSGYRSPEVNTRIGGSPTSQHMKGQAADFYPVNMTRKAAFIHLFNSQYPIRQCILYPENQGNFIHVSIDPQRPAKKQFLIKDSGSFYPYNGGEINL